MFEYVALAAVSGMYATSRYLATRRRRVWEAVAQARDGGYRFNGTHHYIDYLHGDDLSVQMATGLSPSLLMATKHTRGAAVLEFAPGPRFEIRADGALGSMANVVASAIGIDKSVLGKHAGFDRTFTVLCPDGAGTRAMWTERAMRLMYEHFRKGVIRSDGEHVTLEWSGYCGSEDKLNAALDLLQELRGQDAYGVRALQELTGLECDVDVPSGRPRATMVTRAEVILGPEKDDGALVMVARLSDVPTGLPTMQVRVDEQGRILESASGAASESAPGADKLLLTIRPRLAKVGGGVLFVDADRHGETRYVWDGLETEVERLRAGAELLGALADGEGAGVFR